MNSDRVFPRRHVGPGGARLWTAAILCLLPMLGVNAQSLEIIDLKHRTAQEVIPVLQPLLDPGGALSGQDYKLFVRTNAANLAQLRGVLAQIDRAARQLLVSVRQGTAQEIERERLAASGTVRAGDASTSVNERPRASTGVTVHATDNTSRTGRDNVASVRVSEGTSAFIATSSSVPIVTAFVGVAGRKPWIAGSTDFRDLSSGFVVTPRVSGTQVVLDIEQHSDNVVSSGAIETQQLTTQVAGTLGQWLQLGGVSESATSDSRGILSGQYATRSDERSIWVRVEAQ
jgi:hypothetical protein